MKKYEVIYTNRKVEIVDEETVDKMIDELEMFERTDVSQIHLLKDDGDFDTIWTEEEGLFVDGFGYPTRDDYDDDEDEYDDEYLARTDFYKAVAEADLELLNEEETPFAPYIDYCGFGTCYQEYHCYEIISHPSNEKYNCDSICIALSSKDMLSAFLSISFMRFVFNTAAVLTTRLSFSSI